MPNTPERNEPKTMVKPMMNQERSVIARYG